MNDYFVRLAMRAAGTITPAAPARRMEVDVGELGEAEAQTEVQTEATAPAEVRAGPIETAPGPIETAAVPTEPVDAPAAPAADREMAAAEPRVATATTPPAIAAPSDQANEAAPMLEPTLSATSPRPESIAPPPPVVAVTKNVTQQVIEPRESVTRTVIIHETELRTEERESALPPPIAIPEPIESAGMAGALHTTREIVVAAPAEPRSVTVLNPVVTPVINAAAPPPPPGEEISVEVRIGRLDIRPPAPPPAPPPTPAGPEYPRGFAGYERARNYRDRDWY